MRLTVRLPAPDAAPPSPSSFRARAFAQHTVVLALMGSPCAPAREPGTALDFRSRGGPLQVDDAAFREPIHSTALKARPSRRCRPCPARQDGITTPGRRRNASPGWITLFHF